MSPADQSVRKQLPYVPKYSPSLTGYISWGTWAFLYKWAFYSECFTMSSNDYTLIGDLPRYFMSNILFEKKLLLKPMDVQLKCPMPGINFELFIGITSKSWKN